MSDIQAAPQGAKYVPSGWETVGTALAWITFKHAVPPDWWNEVFYFGAERWFEAAPEAVADMLDWAAANPNAIESESPWLAAALRTSIMLKSETGAMRLRDWRHAAAPDGIAARRHGDDG
ncbi:hypothetical protein [Roseicella aerolata]|uniref:Uncharacterized protein n=1 Tax=Roseicella aerolata TaxID=2883479 RepID=A0A9X1I9I5_9PROT|nr:hypothetical protein [Roseicella aerolata]MCB4820755.1 hypothetical protein [Roseicella aerolata]